MGVLRKIALILAIIIVWLVGQEVLKHPSDPINLAFRLIKLVIVSLNNKRAAMPLQLIKQHKVTPSILSEQLPLKNYYHNKI